MKKILVALSLLGSISLASAGESCQAAAQSVNIFFANGSAVSLESARNSLNKLRSAIGDSHNDQKITYSIAYNKSSGIVGLLAPSTTQAAIEWNSQVMGWFNGVGGAPTWFNEWYQKYSQSVIAENVSDVSEHADQFSRSIVNGQKVLVVAHSKGNYYVNEAKRIMQQTLPAEKMQSFSAFGVGVPTSNVAGNSDSYLTNHRDYIQTVVGALPQNWTLRGSDGLVSQDMDAVKAHSFNETYMSTNFDVRAAIVSGVKSKIVQTTQAARDCSIYRRAILSMVEGTYETCSGPEIITQTGATAKIGNDLTTFNYVDLTLSGDTFSLSTSTDHGGSVSLAAVSPDYFLNYNWGTAGVFVKPFRTCSSLNSQVKETKLKAPVEITRTMMGVMDKKINYFYNTCRVTGSDGKVKLLPGLTALVISGTTIKIGDFSWDFGSNWNSESVSDAVNSLRADKDPGFTLLNTDNAGRLGMLEYRNTTGLRSVSITEWSTPGLPGMSCNSR